MRRPVSNAVTGSMPGMSRWEILCALQGLLPSLKTAVARLDLTQMAYWLEQADAELAKIIKGRPSDTTAIPALIETGPDKQEAGCKGIGGYRA